MRYMKNKISNDILGIDIPPPDNLFINMAKELKTDCFYTDRNSGKIKAIINGEDVGELSDDELMRIRRENFDV